MYGEIYNLKILSLFYKIYKTSFDKTTANELLS
jgi:hypothetical protein